VRSLLNVANGIEEGYSYGDRYEYLRDKIHQDGALLLETHKFFERQSVSDRYHEFSNDFLEEDLDIYRIEDDCEISSFFLPSKVALTLYIDFSLYTNAPIEDLQIPGSLIYDKNFTYVELNSENVDLKAKNLIFLILNGRRHLHH